MSGTENPTPKTERNNGGKRLLKPGQRNPDSGRSAVENVKSRLSRGPGRWKQLSRRERMILLVPVAVVLVAVVAANLLLNRKLMTLTLTGQPCQYYGGSIYRMAEGTTLRRTEEGKTLIRSGGGERTANDLPIYYEDREEVTITQDMVYYAPRSGDHGRLGYFSHLSADAGGQVTLERDGEKTVLERGFAFNGKDLYLFLEPVVLSFNGYRMNLPALSYVEAVYTGDIMVFDYGSKEFLIEAPKGAVTARIETGDYEISMLNDSMTNYGGKRTLLFSRPELLEPIALK